ncbi:UDP-glycosyltransferase 73C1-like, partial [Trifolium medium]|nr:UDP-glycosyltransferase 73C1-like [Trifolium medium]
MNEIMANNESEYFVLPGIPDKIEMTIAQARIGFKGETWKQFNDDVIEAEMGTYGIIMNSFEELEPTYAREYKK